MKAIVTVIGKDKSGIIAKVSGALYENGVNIEDISQTIMQDMFTMIMLVKSNDTSVSIKDITEKLNKVGEEMEVAIHVQREEIFSSMHRI